MVFSWLWELPKAARLFYPFAVSGYAKGLSANSILKSYTAAGPGIRRSLGLLVVRKVQMIETAAGAFRALKKGVLPSLSKIPVSATDMLEDFSYLVDFQAITATGKTVTGHLSIVSMNIITREEAEADALDYLNNMPENYGIESVEKVQLAGIKQSKILGQR